MSENLTGAGSNELQRLLIGNKMRVGRLLSNWEGNFSGATWMSREVSKWLVNGL